MKSDVRIVTKTGEKRHRRFDVRDLRQIATFIMDEYGKRKRLRRELEEHWNEVDRQVAMVPEKGDRMVGLERKMDAWMPEMELPLQAQTLEVLTADARRMILPDSGSFFTAHAALTDQYLDRVDFQSLISGDLAEVPSKINQDNADKLVQGCLNYWHRQYDFGKHLDLINAESFKYGTGVGRARLVTKDILINDARGTRKAKRKFPVLIPRSIRDTYLDESESSMMHEGFFLGPAVIYKQKIKYRDLVLAASRGSDNPDSMEGGWMPKFLKGITPDDDDEVTLVEWEGDLVVPRVTTDALVLPGAIVTVVAWDGSDPGESVIRMRFRKHPFSTYIEFPYHYERQDSAYGTSPLLKGRPIQKAATDALNRLIAVGALNAEPPVGYDSDDITLAADGGPRIFPGAQWKTLSDITVHQIGDPIALFNIYAGFLQQYADVTGINAPRLGAQTVSHTTAFAKDVELARGQVRTVDYVRNTLKGPLHQWVNMAYVMGKEVMDNTRFYIDEYGGFVDIDKRHLPDDVTFEVHGSGGPQEEQEKAARRLQSLQMALQMDQLGVQLGREPTIDTSAAIEQVLREGGWTDIDVITRGDSVPPGNANGSPLGQTGAIPGVSSAAPALVS
jgi:hypothetical protein